MKHFEIKESNDEIRDANEKMIEIIPTPDDHTLEQLTVQTINESNMERVRLISNITNEIDEDDEGLIISDIPAEVTKLTVEKIMIELTGESWFTDQNDDGYSAGEIIELLSQKAFVQLSELTYANVKACLDNGGKIIAYFPDLVWREYFNQLQTIPDEVLGLRVIEIEKIIENNRIVINDRSSVNGKGMKLDMTAFNWLSRDGWMLEVYK